MAEKNKKQILAALLVIFLGISAFQASNTQWFKGAFQAVTGSFTNFGNIGGSNSISVAQNSFIEEPPFTFTAWDGENYEIGGSKQSALSGKSFNEIREERLQETSDIVEDLNNSYQSHIEQLERLKATQDFDAMATELASLSQDFENSISGNLDPVEGYLDAANTLLGIDTNKLNSASEDLSRFKEEKAEYDELLEDYDDTIQSMNTLKTHVGNMNQNILNANNLLYYPPDNELNSVLNALRNVRGQRVLLAQKLWNKPFHSQSYPFAASAAVANDPSKYESYPNALNVFGSHGINNNNLSSNPKKLRSFILTLSLRDANGQNGIEARDQTHFFVGIQLEITETVQELSDEKNELINNKKVSNYDFSFIQGKSETNLQNEVLKWESENEATLSYINALSSMTSNVNEWEAEVKKQYKEINALLGNVKPLEIKVETESNASVSLFYANPNNTALPGVELPSADYSVASSNQSYTVEFDGLVDDLFFITASKTGYVTSTSEAIPAKEAGSFGTPVTLTLQPGYLLEVKDEDSDALIQPDSISIDGKDDYCEESGNSFECLIPTTGSVETYEVQLELEGYDDKTFDYSFARANDESAQQEISFTMSKTPEAEPEPELITGFIYLIVEDEDGDPITGLSEYEFDFDGSGDPRVMDFDEVDDGEYLFEIEPDSDVDVTVEPDDYESESKDDLELYEDEDEAEDNATFFNLSEIEDVLSSSDYNCTNFFSDFPGDDLLCRLRDANVIEGVGGGRFGHGKITEAAFVKILASSLGYTERDGNSLPEVEINRRSGPYNDRSWYDPWYRIAQHELGYIPRLDYVNPGQFITRERAAVLAARSRDLTLFGWDGSDVSFTDLKVSGRTGNSPSDFIGSTYAILLMNRTVVDVPGQGLTKVIEGYANNTFRPYENIERRDAMYMLYRIMLAWDLDLIEDQEVFDGINF